MTDALDRSDQDPGAVDLGDPPTSYGGSNDVEPERPGQSLGQMPDPDDAGVDEAGDRTGPGRGDAGREASVGIEPSGTPAGRAPAR